MTNDLFSSARLGSIALKNRFVLAPLTRNRAGAGNVPSEFAATYYAQRATAGLIITEATQVSDDAQAYPNTPGLYSPEQIAGWRVVTDAVHAAGGKIAVQLWHTGRVSHSVYRPDGLPPLAPSAIAAAGTTYSPAWQKIPNETPRALDQAGIDRIVAAFGSAAANAKAAGFDGIEIHGANGYLIDQFLRDGTNHRTDAYGGSPEKRTRFLSEVVAAVVKGFGNAGAVGVRLSPHNPYNDMSDSNPAATFTAAAAALKPFGLGFLHVLEPVGTVPPLAADLKAASGLPLIVNGGYERDSANAVIASGVAETVAFGKLYIANPDLPARFAANAALNEPDASSFYGGTDKGYIDYPALETAVA